MGERLPKETFTSRLRDELLDREVFANLKGAKVLAEDYRDRYNHGALEYLTPAQFTAIEALWAQRAPLCAHRGTEGARIGTETLIMTGTENGDRSLLQDDAGRPNG